MSLKRIGHLIACACCSGAATLYSQAPGPTSGEITVQLVQGLDSAANPQAMSQGRVTKSTNPAVPVGSQVLMGVQPDATDGGYVVRLMKIDVGKGPVPASSSTVAASPDIFIKMQERLRAPGQPQDTVSGARVFLPQRMIIRFTLAPPERTANPTAATTASATGTLPALPAPATWRIANTPVGPEATLLGQYVADGKRGPALLAVGCTTATSYTTGVNAGSLVMQLRLSLSSVSFEYGSLTMEGGSDNDYIRSQLGDAPEIHIDLSADNVGEGPVAPFDLGYETPDLRRIINATDTTLKLTVWPPEEHQAQMVAIFKLPTDGTAMRRMAHPCLERRERQDQESSAKEKLATVLQCPNVEGKALVNTVILVGPNRKELEMDGDSEGTSWILPKATRTRVRPKLTAVCKYGEPGYSTALKPITDKREVPIPANASFCSRSHHTTGNVEDFSCSKEMAQAWPAATKQ